MIVDNPRLTVPCAETTLWRYMSIEKFLALLQSGKLYFSALAAMDDPFEGLFPPALQSSVLEMLRKDSHRLGYSTEWTNTDIHLFVRKGHYVTCWHVNSDDSAAMWSLYSGSSGVAITTTVGVLRSCLTSSTEHITLGRVKYLDYRNAKTAELDAFRLPFIKRSSFEHEQEFRVAIYRKESLRSIEVPVDLNRLISEIVVAPTSATWLHEVVRDVAARYGCTAQVRRSDLYTLS
jgi:hypothetical protein